MPDTIATALADSGLDPIDAKALLRHALQVSDAFLIAHSADPLTGEQRKLAERFFVRRRHGEPVAYITGIREFFSLEFKVTPAVLIPRPETELLVQFALEHTPVDHAAHVLDLGTGSGCIAISVAMHRPRARVFAVDRSAAALAVARENAARHEVDNVEFLESDWYSTLKQGDFDIIVANPPYVAVGDPHLTQGDVRYEPFSALAADDDGLDCIRRIVEQAPQYLKSGGWLAIEHGYDQGPNCRLLLPRAGFVNLKSIEDLAGIVRITAGSRDWS